MNRSKSEIAIMEVEINFEVAALTDAIQAAKLGREDHEGLVPEKT